RPSRRRLHRREDAARPARRPWRPHGGRLGRTEEIAWIEFFGQLVGGRTERPGGVTNAPSPPPGSAEAVPRLRAGVLHAFGAGQRVPEIAPVAEVVRADAHAELRRAD